MQTVTHSNTQTFMSNIKCKAGQLSKIKESQPISGKWAYLITQDKLWQVKCGEIKTKFKILIQLVRNGDKLLLELE